VLVLGIETSCDETAAAVVEDGRWVRADVVASQVLTHAPYGGVVPEVASRQHIATIIPVIRRAVADAGIGFGDLDAVAVTCGPGLVGALLVGVETSKALAFALGKPLVGVNHLAGHLAAAFLEDGDPGRVPKPPRDGSQPAEPVGIPRDRWASVDRWASGAPSGVSEGLASGASGEDSGRLGSGALGGGGQRSVPPFPHLALLVSGGHTAIIRVDEPGKTRLLGATRDDAAGEAFDKVGKLLGLGYPGGVAIDKLAATGNSRAVSLPRAMAGRDDLDFSFSGLKTAVSTWLGKRGSPGSPVGAELADLCASFQTAVVDVLVRKSRRALAMEGLAALVVCGGVAANRGLRASLAEAARADGFGLFIPPPKRCTDNASMIAAAGTDLFRRGRFAGLDLAVDPGLEL
jgi:N6-L-threonylcarbamoyladenine synthase